MAGKSSENNVSKFVNKEFSGMVLLLFSAFILACLFTGDSLFYLFGGWVQMFFMGTLGFFAFPLFFFCLLTSLMLIVGRPTSTGRAKNCKSN